MSQANLIEIFSSFQGEGCFVGEEMLFVRFQDCALSCQYCDTPASFKRLAEFRVETVPASGRFEYFSNPIGAEGLNRHLAGFTTNFLTLTGGEPLQHGDFLADWLPTISGRYRVMLETNGVLPETLARVLAHIDIVSMDFKMPSTTGMRDFWKEHEAFLRIANQKQVYVKMVVGNATSTAELAQGLSLIQEARGAGGEVPVILQPVTPKRESEPRVSARKLRELYDFARAASVSVRVIPQTHPLLGVL